MLWKEKGDPLMLKYIFSSQATSVVFPVAAYHVLMAGLLQLLQNKVQTS